VRSPLLSLVAAALAAGVLSTAGAAGAAEDPSPRPWDLNISKDPRIKEELLGPMAIEPVTGDIYTYLKITTAGGCPGGTNSVTRVFAEGFPLYGENVIGNTEVAEYMTHVEGRMVAPLTITLDEAMKRQPKPTTLNGLARFTFTCQDPMPTSYDMLYGYYEGFVRFDDDKYTAITTIKDLPKVPRPAPGPAALALASNPQANYDPAAEAQEAADAAQLAANSSETGDGNGSAALVAAGVSVVLLGAGGAVLLVRRRETTGVGTGGRR
jgi:LPXTG-motif cell wall-anchored protein